MFILSPEYNSLFRKLTRQKSWVFMAWGLYFSSCKLVFLCSPLRCRTYYLPIRAKESNTSSLNKQVAQRTGKREWPRRSCFCFLIWLAAMVAQNLQDQSQKEKSETDAIPDNPWLPFENCLSVKFKKLPDRQKISLMHMFCERVYDLCWAVNTELLNVRDWKRRTVWMYSSLEIKLMDNIRQFTAVTKHFRWLKKFKVRRSKLYHAISNRATPKDRMVKGR